MVNPPGGERDGCHVATLLHEGADGEPERVGQAELLEVEGQR